MALAGVRVLDLSERLSGAYSARLMGDFGADVLLVEPASGHELRREPPFVGGNPSAERSLLHGMVNWNKRSLVHDMETDAAAVAELASGADVLVTTAVRPWPATVAAAVEALPDDAVHLSVTAHGLEGPLASVPGCSLTACARTGWAVINGVNDMPPLQLPVRQVSYLGGVAGFLSATAAVYRGTGETVDVSEVEAVAMTSAPWAFSNGIFPAFKDGEPLSDRFPKPGNCQGGGSRGLEHGRSTPGPMLWPTNDGQINFGMGDWVLWDEAMDFLGLDDMIDSIYTPTWGRYNHDLRPVVQRLGDASQTFSKWEIFHGLAELRCITGVVQNSEELLAFEQLQAREFFVESTVDGVPFKAPGPITRLSGTPWELTSRAPVLGEHQGQSWLAPLSTTRPDPR
eukprot:COSAG04_NODE_2049_length_4917_cov_3.895600_5_plen_399_part_00